MQRQQGLLQPTLGLFSALIIYVTVTAGTTRVVEEVRLTGGGRWDEGRVEVRMGGGGWGTVCDDEWDHQDASVVCRMLHQTGGIAYSKAYFGQGQGPILLDSVGCAGDEDNLNMCMVGLPDVTSSSACTHAEDAGVRCGMEPPASVSGFGSGDSEKSVSPVRLSPLSGNCPYGIEGSANVRLVGSGRYPTSGLVQVRDPSQGITEFGFVCDDSWSLLNARVVCAQLCFQPADALPGWHKPRRLQLPSHPGIVLDDVTCRGSEASLLDCPHPPFNLHDCSPSELAAVTCTNVPASPSVPQAEVECLEDRMVVTFRRRLNPRLDGDSVVPAEDVPVTCRPEKFADTDVIRVALSYRLCARLMQNGGPSGNLTFLSSLLVPLPSISPSERNGLKRITQYKIKVKCKVEGQNSASRRLPHVGQPVLPASGDTKLTVTMTMFQDHTFTQPVPSPDVVLAPGGWINLGLALNTNQRIRLVVTSCYAGPDLSDPTKPRQALLLDKCVQEDTVSTYTINDTFWGIRFQPFSFANFSDVTIQCETFACRANDASCDRSCNSATNKRSSVVSRRRRRKRRSPWPQRSRDQSSCHVTVPADLSSQVFLFGETPRGADYSSGKTGPPQTKEVEYADGKTAPPQTKEVEYADGNNLLPETKEAEHSEKKNTEPPQINLSPSLNPEGISPSPNPEGISSSPNPEGISPSPNPEGISPSPNPEGISPSPNPEGISPSPNPEGISPSPNQEGISPSPNPEGISPSPNQEGISPSPNPEGISPSLNPEGISPSPNPEGISPSPNQEGITLPETERTISVETKDPSPAGSQYLAKPAQLNNCSNFRMETELILNTTYIQSVTAKSTEPPEGQGVVSAETKTAKFLATKKFDALETEDTIPQETKDQKAKHVERNNAILLETVNVHLGKSEIHLWKTKKAVHQEIKGTHNLDGSQGNLSETNKAAIIEPEEVDLLTEKAIQGERKGSLTSQGNGGDLSGTKKAVIGEAEEAHPWIRNLVSSDRTKMDRPTVISLVNMLSVVTTSSTAQQLTQHLASMREKGVSQSEWTTADGPEIQKLQSEREPKKHPLTKTLKKLSKLGQLSCRTHNLGVLWRLPHPAEMPSQRKKSVLKESKLTQAEPTTTEIDQSEGAMRNHRKLTLSQLIQSESLLQVRDSEFQTEKEMRSHQGSGLQTDSQLTQLESTLQINDSEDHQSEAEGRSHQRPGLQAKSQLTQSESKSQEHDQSEAQGKNHQEPGLQAGSLLTQSESKSQEHDQSEGQGKNHQEPGLQAGSLLTQSESKSQADDQSEGEGRSHATWKDSPPGYLLLARLTVPLARAPGHR